MNLKLSVLALWIIEARCWGTLGHRTVAYVALEYLNCHEIQELHRLAGFDDLSDAAIWADEVSKQPLYDYSTPWHYLNVLDSPPEVCNISIPRDHDANSSDILSAFANHTNILRRIESTTHQRREAIRYLVHWFGDIHQPLHVESIGRGGNDISVTFDGQQTNLHAVWDINIPEKHRILDDEKEAARNWAQELFSQDSSPQQNLQNECHDVSTPMICILQWAQQSNSIVCNAVLNGGIENVRRQDLGKTYYEVNLPIVATQILLAGRRLASWTRSLLLVMGDQDLSQEPLQQWILGF